MASLLAENHVPGSGTNILWPVSLSEIGVVRDHCTQLLVGLCRDRASDGDAAGLLNVLSPYIIVDVTSAFQAAAMASRASAELRQRLDGRPGRLWPAALAGRKPLPPDALRILRTGWRPPGFLRDCAHAVRSYLRRESPRYEITALTDFSEGIVCFTRAGLMLDHLRRVNEKAAYVHPAAWFPPLPAATLSPSVPDWLKPAVEEMVRQAFAAAGETLPQWLKGYFPDWIGEAVALCQLRLDALRRRPARLPKQLWTGSAGKVWARLLRMAVIEAGGYVVCHDHGGGSGHCREPYKALRDWEFCSEFIAYSGQQRDNFLSCFDADFYVPRTLPKMSVCKSSETALVARRRERPDRIRRVIYVSGLSDGEHLHLAPLMTTEVMLDWQQRMLSALCAGGWEVSWKPHPDAARPSAQLIEQLPIKILGGKFEDALEHVDGIVIDTCRTSAFPLAIASNLPIVLVNFTMYELDNLARSLLEQRGVVIDGWFDGGNQAQIDFPQLHDAIRKSRELESTAFQDRFY